MSALVIHGWPQEPGANLARLTPCGVDVHTMPPNHRVTFLSGEINCAGCRAAEQESK